MSVLKRLYNVAYGKVKASVSPETGPVVAEDELRPARPPVDDDAPTDPVDAREPIDTVRPAPVAPRPRRL